MPRSVADTHRLQTADSDAPKVSAVNGEYGATNQRSDRGAGLRADVAYLCEQLDSIRLGLDTSRPEDAVPLERLLEALSTGNDLAVPMEELHQALLAAGDAVGVHGPVRGLNAPGVGRAIPEA